MAKQDQQAVVLFELPSGWGYLNAYHRLEHARALAMQQRFEYQFGWSACLYYGIAADSAAAQWGRRKYQPPAARIRFSRSRAA